MLEQDSESAWLELDPAEETDAMPHILGSSVSYRIAVGPQQGRKAFMIRTIRPLDRPDPGLEQGAKANGFSLHAGVNCEGHQKNKRERLCRYDQVRSAGERHAAKTWAQRLKRTFTCRPSASISRFAVGAAGRSSAVGSGELIRQLAVGDAGSLQLDDPAQRTLLHAGG